MLEHLESTPTRPARVVVIGAGGFVGGAIAGRLVADGVAVLALTRAELDLLQPDAAARLKDLLRPADSVVFVSALAPAKTVPLLMQNLRMAEAACAALAETEIAHLLYVSSDAVYADDANPVTERSPLAPSTLHGMMHAARESMLRASTRAPFAALRPTLIYGAADPHNGYGPNRFRRQAARGEPIAIFGEGEERRDHVAIEDVAALAALMLARRSAGALNAATGRSISFREVAETVAAQFGGRVPVESRPRQGTPPHLAHRHFDIAGCHRAFPRFRFTALAEGLRRAMQRS